ncbi:MAG: GFA family protein [Burkholderiales bacterium]
MCRKAHGAAFATYGRVQSTDFILTSGADSIASYRSSPEVTRTFCKRCELDASIHQHKAARKLFAGHGNSRR